MIGCTLHEKTKPQQRLALLSDAFSVLESCSISMGPRPRYFLADSLNPRNSPLPRVTNVDVKGLRQRTAKYSILFTPIATLPSSLLISHGSFKRCVPWGEIPGQKMKDDEMFGCHS